jgi:polysaccharide pyruvyl transferase WcaK-like protein
MPKRYLIYGHGGSYNHGAEALARTTMTLLRKQTPGCWIALSTHFAEQDREFHLPADEFLERDMSGSTNAETYAPTIGAIAPDAVCLHIGGDNYCYRNWQRWSLIHYAALARGAKSVLWSCSIDPQAIDGEMLDALRTHDLITVREGVTFNALAGLGLTNVRQVSDIAFSLEAEPVDFRLDNYVVLNISPITIKYNAALHAAYQALVDFIAGETDMNIALVPHVLQQADNDYDALRGLDARNPSRVRLVSGKLSAGQYKSIIGNGRFCVAARTHAAIAAYSSCVPTLAVSYSAKSRGIAADLYMSRHVVDIGRAADVLELKNKFIELTDKEQEIKSRLADEMPRYIEKSICVNLNEV